MKISMVAAEEPVAESIIILYTAFMMTGVYTGIRSFKPDAKTSRSGVVEFMERCCFLYTTST